MNRTCNHCGVERNTLKTCTRCKAARYCGKSCQQKAWTVHQSECCPSPTSVSSTEPTCVNCLTGGSEALSSTTMWGVVCDRGMGEILVFVDNQQASKKARQEDDGSGNDVPVYELELELDDVQAGSDEALQTLWVVGTWLAVGPHDNFLDGDFQCMCPEMYGTTDDPGICICNDHLGDLCVGLLPCIFKSETAAEAAVALGATLQGIGGNSADVAVCKLLDVEDVPLSAQCVARSTFMLAGQQVYAKYSSDV